MALTPAAKNFMTFKEKVQAMTGKEILGAMIAGLQKEWVKVDMTTFGEAKYGICYGCAATNAVFEITGVPVNEDAFYDGKAIINGVRPEYIGTEIGFLEIFEKAVDKLRCGHIDGYNEEASRGIFAQLSLPEIPLPYLTTEYWRENLKYYIDYYNALP